MSQIDKIYERIEEKVETVRYNPSDSEISRFFSGQNVFITGVSGYLGKCVLEKLLRSCPDVKQIYVTMRANKKYSLEERTSRYFQHVVFDRVREENPNFLKKITVVKGDLMVKNIGLSEKDRKTIVNQVDIIYHNAANVKFDDRASASLKANVLGTKMMLDLAKECKNVKLFVYVSTAYSHLYKKDIKEEFYPSPATLETVYEVIEADEKTENGLSEEQLQKYIGDFPNIYPYTKAIAEGLVEESAKNNNFAHAIYRPSIVTSSLKEPLPGWWGNTNGPVLIFLAAVLGFLRVVYHRDCPIDFIPSDYTVNALIAVTRDAHVQWSQNRQKHAFIYNFGSTTVNPLTFKMMREYDKEVPLLEKSSKAVALNTSSTMTDRLWEFYIWHFLLHFIPSCLVDAGLWISGRKPVLLSIFWKATKHLDKIDYFGNGNWRIHISRTLGVIDKMNPADHEIFYCDIRKLAWQEAYWIGWRGMKVHMLKEEVISEAGRRRYYLLCYIHYAFRLIWAFVFGYVLFKFLPV